MSDMDLFFRNTHEWATRTFRAGRAADPRPPLHHLNKEVGELLAEPFDLEEYADALLLLLDAAYLAGFTFSDIFDAARIKFAINQKRQWGAPDENGVVEHLREEAATK